MQQYPIMFVLKDGRCPNLASKIHVSDDDSPRYHINLIGTPESTFSFRSCIESEWIPIYDEMPLTKEIQVTGMFSKYGDNLVTKVVKDVCNALEVGVKRETALFYLKHQLTEIGKTHPEVSDTVIRENIGYYLDVFLVLNGMDETALEDLTF